MFTILLAIIYISFISLGLPDALLGSAWPSMYQGLEVPVSYAGIISMIITGGTILSSLQSDRLIRKLGTGKLTALSVGLTALSLFGFSTSHSFLLLCLWAIPYGLGAGSVDAALNNFVALHYKAKHMSWLHCFWGIGATLGPYIMGFCLTRKMEWTMGYRVVFLIQLALTAALIFTLPLWNKNNKEIEAKQESAKSASIKELLKMPGIPSAFVAFFCYCALESTTGLWGSSYLVMEHGISPDTAAKWISLFYLGITIGRLFAGFIVSKLGNRNLIRLGQCIAALGIIFLLLPFGGFLLSTGFFLIGMGCAPIYPCMLHATPDNFGKELSQAVMGIQMACAYIGSTLMPPFTGFIVEHINMNLFPLILLAITVLMAVMSEHLNKKRKSIANHS